MDRYDAAVGLVPALARFPCPPSHSPNANLGEVEERRSRRLRIVTRTLAAGWVSEVLCLLDRVINQRADSCFLNAYRKFEETGLFGRGATAHRYASNFLLVFCQICWSRWALALPRRQLT